MTEFPDVRSNVRGWLATAQLVDICIVLDASREEVIARGLAGGRDLGEAVETLRRQLRTLGAERTQRPIYSGDCTWRPPITPPPE